MKTENLCDLGLGDEICHQKHDTWGKKNRPVILLKLKTSLWKTLLREWEDKIQIGRKYLQKTSDKELVSQKYTKNS